MKTGISTASLFLRRDNLQTVKLMGEMGVKNAEVFLTTYSEYDKKFAKKLAEAKGDMSVNSVHILNTQFEPQLFGAHPLVKADAFSWLKKVMECAQILDAPYYTFHGTARVKKASRSGNNDDFSKIIPSFQEITSFCQNYGVTLCLENVEWSTYNRPGVFTKIASAVPTLKGVLDIKQARISGFPYEDYLDEMGEKIAYVHLLDINEQGKTCLPGKGVFDFETLIKRLSDKGFNGNLFIEAYAGDYDKEEELKISCDYLNELIDKIL